MQKTTNYELNKIELTDAPADITVLNPNWDKIDEKLKAHDDALPTKREHTIEVIDADLNTLLGDKTYSCIGTLTNAPIACSQCIVQVFDTGVEGQGVVTQICYVPQTNRTVRSFVRSITNGTSIGAWSELLTSIEHDDTIARLDRLIEENTFRSQALCKALQNDVSFLVVECFESSVDIDTTKDDGQTVVDTMFNAPFHSIDKTGDDSVTIQCLPKVNTKSNANAWVWADYIGSGSCLIEISRDNGTTFTTVPNDTMVSLNSQPSGVSLICRLTLSGEITLKNISWGVK